MRSSIPSPLTSPAATRTPPVKPGNGTTATRSVAVAKSNRRATPTAPAPEPTATPMLRTGDTTPSRPTLLTNCGLVGMYTPGPPGVDARNRPLLISAAVRGGATGGTTTV